MVDDFRRQGRATVLVVDDDEAMCDSLKSLLERSGFAVIVAENGVRGLQAFRNVSPALVLVDMQMPKLDGIETIGQMRRERRGAKIVAMSAAPRIGNADILTGARAIGADAAIQKPFDADALLDLLHKLIEGEGGTPGRASAA